MISRISGKLIAMNDQRVIIEVLGIGYEILVSPAVIRHIRQQKTTDKIELVTFHYYTLEQNKCFPILIGFVDELEREFFEKFTSVSGIGPKAALRAFDKPIAQIAQAIEEGNLNFLKSLAGIGPQKAKQIIASLQGKVGRFALLKTDQIPEYQHFDTEIVEEAKHILKRLQYTAKEVDIMIQGVLKNKPAIQSSEELLNEIYRQKIQLK